MVLTRNIVIDIGNTLIKAAVFHGDILFEKIMFEMGNAQSFAVFLHKHKPTHSLISSVRVGEQNIICELKQKTICLELTSKLPVPFINLYGTPQTLGMDRVAGIAGAQHFFINKNCLVIDVGTCVTYDFINAHNEYLGGAISPGIIMRLNAMAYYTQRLPKIAFEHPQSYIGNSTQNSMLSGAYYGLLGEINETVARYQQQFGEIEVLLCGGDWSLFDKHTKKSIFASPDLVLYGLNKILQYNAN